MLQNRKNAKPYITNSATVPGKHLIIDLWGVNDSTDIKLISKMMHEAALECGATVLDSNFHEFGDGFGITGVIVLAESHISIHTWPELSYVALDVFMCGSCNPEKSIPIFKKYLEPSEIKIQEYQRGKRSS